MFLDIVVLVFVIRSWNDVPLPGVHRIVGKPSISDRSVDVPAAGYASPMFDSPAASFIPYSIIPYPIIPYPMPRVPDHELAARARGRGKEADTRRRVRPFAPDPVLREAVRDAIRAASAARSGTHRRPWTFVPVGAPARKRAIREAAAAEERDNDEGGRLPHPWRRALEPRGTTSDQPFLEDPVWIVVASAPRYEPFPVGHPADDCRVPDLTRPPPAEILAGA